MDTLTSMQVFVTIVASGSLTQAAERLHLSKAMVSKHLLYLEDHLSTRLLNRTTRRLSLTESGAAYHERCLAILADIEEARQIATEATLIPRGTLKITLPVAFGLHKLGQLMADFVQMHPQVRLDITLNDRYIDLIEEGLDLAIRIGHLPESGFIARKLGTTHSILCAAPTYLDQQGHPSGSEDLKHHSCLGYTYTNHGSEWHLWKDGIEHVLPLSGVIQANNGDMLRLAAIQGAGIIYQPFFIVEADLESGRLVQVLSDYRSTEMGIYALYPSRKYLSAKVQTFVAFLAKQLTSPF